MEVSPSHQTYMREALREAQIALSKGEVPVGAVVVCQGRIVARAHNLTETLTDVTAHAEMQAITTAAASIGGKYLNQCCLYVTLEPCVMCAGAIGWAQLGGLVYGATDPKKGYTLIPHGLLHPKTVVVAGVLANEASVLVSGFFQRLRGGR